MIYSANIDKEYIWGGGGSGGGSHDMGAAIRKPDNYARQVHQEILHDGEWFMRHAEQAASRATRHFVLWLAGFIALAVTGGLIWAW